MSLTGLPQGKAAHVFNVPTMQPRDGGSTPGAASTGSQISARLQTLGQMLESPNPIQAARNPPPPPNFWRDIQNVVGKAMSVVTAPIDILNQTAASLTYSLAMALPAFPAVRLF